MRQQIVVSGIGGQGVLFVTRFLAETAVDMGLEVLTSEIHGMAMRGGTVLAHVKVGTFRSPLIRQGQADLGIIINAENLPLHKPFIKKAGTIVLNSIKAGDYLNIDADGMARENGFLPGSNLVLVGYAIGKGVLFCNAEAAVKMIRKMSAPAMVDANIVSFSLGRKYAGEA
jgi:indolepyruvate ferredoxin oxidoreductase beta subunit